MSNTRLPRREQEVLDAIFALGNRASVESVRARMTDPPSYSAVRAMLARLERKGHVRHQEQGKQYLYSATKSTTAAKRAALKRYVATFFDGSLSQMMTALVRQESWTDEELAILGDEIERARKERRRV
jgi:predicted transcriptional regulator